VHALELDGFKVSEGVLRRALPIDIGLPAVQSEIDRLLEKHGFLVPKASLSSTERARALARSFGVVQIKPGSDPLKAQVHLDLHRLAPQVVAAQIVDVFANARTGQMRARRAGVGVGSAPTRRRRLPQFTLILSAPSAERRTGGRALNVARGPSRNDDLPLMTALFASVFRGGKRRVWPVWRRLGVRPYAYPSLYLIEQP
jgi:hypothetical protein